ncbi:MAG TPA: hypothetical protein VMA71_05365 [Alloacidobacterium sp.]|nr:hypothetical protein [Alloacidobacterium sp.]
MNSEVVFLGRRISTARQLRRRVLVIAIYAALALLMAVLWATTGLRGSGAYVIWAAILACRFFLGGYYAGGLVKPFNGKAPKQTEVPSSLLAIKLRIYQPVPADDDAAYRNDERELHLRDHAHYLAFQIIGVAVCVPMFIASMRLIRPSLMSWIPMQPDAIYYGLTLVALILFLTLPQAILLWTEPDMEEQ